ncbi:MAG: hypothetical protein WC326_02060 [Candidatus Delongbacteria bacterium]
MSTALLAAAAATCTAAAWYWHRARVTRALRTDRAAWRASLNRGLLDAAQATAQTSEAAAAALKLVAEAIQGTGEMGVLESSVLAERVAEGAGLDARAATAPGIARAMVMLQEIAAARELIRVMDPAGARDASLRDDAIQHLDHATQAYLGKPQHN